MDIPEKDVDDFNRHLRAFRKLRAPAPYVTVVYVALLGFFFLLYQAVDIPILVQLLANHRLERLLYLGYFMILVSMWVVYFLSRTDLIRTRTLRRLLTSVANEWRCESDEREGNNPNFAVNTRDKARASMTMLALLTASSALLMTQSLTYIKSNSPSLPAAGLLDIWQPMLLYASTATSAIALICFIIAVDSLDVLFNHFGGASSRTDNHMVRFFYLSKRDARYYGIMFFLWAACLFSGSFNPLFGALVVGIVIFVGWSHWFPYPPLLATSKENNIDPPANLFEISLRFGIMVLPVLWALVCINAKLCFCYY